MNYKEMEEALANARPAKFASPAKDVALSARDKALIKNLAPTVRELIESEVARATAPLHKEITRLKTLTDFLLRPPCVRERRGHGDARGPNSFEDPTNNYWLQ
jgi:hypothetical protein